MSKELYAELIKPKYSRGSYEAVDRGEGMTLINETIWGWWKPRYLLDHRAKEAYEFLDEYQNFANFSEEDVDLSSIKDVPDEAFARARVGNAQFPTFVGQFKGGIAEVAWQINPDGRYYMDDDGFGMTSDREITLHGAIDRKGRVVKKYVLMNTYTSED